MIFATRMSISGPQTEEQAAQEHGAAKASRALSREDPATGSKWLGLRARCQEGDWKGTLDKLIGYWTYLKAWAVNRITYALQQSIFLGAKDELPKI